MSRMWKRYPFIMSNVQLCNWNDTNAASALFVRLAFQNISKGDRHRLLATCGYRAVGVGGTSISKSYPFMLAIVLTYLAALINENRNTGNCEVERAVSYMYTILQTSSRARCTLVAGTAGYPGCLMSLDNIWENAGWFLTTLLAVRIPRILRLSVLW